MADHKYSDITQIARIMTASHANAQFLSVLFSFLSGRAATEYDGPKSAAELRNVDLDSDTRALALEMFDAAAAPRSNRAARAFIRDIAFLDAGGVGICPGDDVAQMRLLNNIGRIKSSAIQYNLLRSIFPGRGTLVDLKRRMLLGTNENHTASDVVGMMLANNVQCYDIGDACTLMSAAIALARREIADAIAGPSPNWERVRIIAKNMQMDAVSYKIMVRTLRGNRNDTGWEQSVAYIECIKDMFDFNKIFADGGIDAPDAAQLRKNDRKLMAIRRKYEKIFFPAVAKAAARQR